MVCFWRQHVKRRDQLKTALFPFGVFGAFFVRSAAHSVPTLQWPHTVHTPAHAQASPANRRTIAHHRLSRASVRTHGGGPITDGSTGETALAVNSNLWLTASILQMVHPDRFAWWGNNDHPTTIALAANIQAFAGQDYELFDVTADGSCGPRALAEGLRREGGGVFPTAMGMNDAQPYSWTYTTVHFALLHTDIYDKQRKFLRRSNLVDRHIMHHSLGGSVKLQLSQAVLQQQVNTNRSWMGMESTQAFATAYSKNVVVFSAKQVSDDLPTTYLAHPGSTGGTPLFLANWLDKHGLGHYMLVQMHEPVAVWTLMLEVYEARRQQQALRPIPPPELIADDTEPLAKIPRRVSEPDNHPTSSNPGLTQVAGETAMPFSEQTVHAGKVDVAVLSPGSWCHFNYFSARN